MGKSFFLTAYNNDFKRKENPTISTDFSKSTQDMLQQLGATLLVSKSSVAFQCITAENRCIFMVIILTPLTLFCNYLGSCYASQSCSEI